MRHFSLFFLGLLFTGLIFAGICSATDQEHAIRQVLEDFLVNQPTASLSMITTGTDPAIIDRQLLGLYVRNRMQPFWLEQGGLNSKAKALVKTLQDSASDGLSPDDYKVAEILTLEPRQDEASRARLDVLLTLALVRYIADIKEGSADPCLLDPVLFASARDQEVDIQQVVDQALQTEDIVSFLKDQAPSHAAYQGLRRALARYRQIEGNGGWKQIPTGKTIHPGDSDPRLPLIAQRLEITGELKSIPRVYESYDQELVEAVKKFQSHFLLDQDGVIGKNTLEALNIPVSHLIHQIIVNMERWRWLPHRFSGKQLLVNIAAFQLFGTTDEHVDISMPVIVGKVYHKTPVFTGNMRYLEINPYWNIPDSIAMKEMVPHMQKNPHYLQENNIRMFNGWQENAPEVNPATIDWNSIGSGIKRYRLRQDPGPDNALGRIKFMFPNKYDVYLHDTPTHHLFLKTKRSFSHGCIRVSQPQELASYLLTGSKNSLTVEQLNQLVAEKKRKVLLLDDSIPVHIIYLTAKALPDSDEVFFYPDIYERDALLEKALFSRQPLSQCDYPAK